jgi:putative salt-induced outer membrane protein
VCGGVVVRRDLVYSPAFSKTKEGSYMMIQSVVRGVALAAVAASSLLAQAPAPAPAPKPPYEFIADFALAASQGNQEVNTVSLGQKYSYDFGTWKFSQFASALRGSANGVKNAELYQGGARGDYNLTKKLTAYISTAGLRNTPAGLKSQFNEGIGIGYKFVDTDMDKFQMSAGFGALQRSFLGRGGNTSDAVGNVDGLYRHLFSKVSYFEQTAGLTPNFTTTKAWLFTSNSALVAPLSAKIGIKIGYLINYNNAPPLIGTTGTTRFKKFDGLLTTGVQFTY